MPRGRGRTTRGSCAGQLSTLGGDSGSDWRLLWGAPCGGGRLEPRRPRHLSGAAGQLADAASSRMMGRACLRLARGRLLSEMAAMPGGSGYFRGIQEGSEASRRWRHEHHWRQASIIGQAVNSYRHAGDNRAATRRRVLGRKSSTRSGAAREEASKV